MFLIKMSLQLISMSGCNNKSWAISAWPVADAIINGVLSNFKLNPKNDQNKKEFYEKIRFECHEKIRLECHEKIRLKCHEKIRFECHEKIRFEFYKKIRFEFYEKIRFAFYEKKRFEWYKCLNIKMLLQLISMFGFDNKIWTISVQP